MPFFHIWGRILTKRARTGCGMRLRTTSVASVLAWNTCKDKDMSRMSSVLMRRSSLLLAFAALEIRMFRTNDPDWRSPGRKVGSPYKSWKIKSHLHSGSSVPSCYLNSSRYLCTPLSEPQCLALCWDPMSALHPWKTSRWHSSQSSTEESRTLHNGQHWLQQFAEICAHLVVLAGFAKLVKISISIQCQKVFNLMWVRGNHLAWFISEDASKTVLIYWLQKMCIDC